VHKKCDFDCDCSDCVEQVRCHENKCYCLNDYDDCDNLMGNITQNKGTKTTTQLYGHVTEVTTTTTTLPVTEPGDPPEGGIMPEVECPVSKESHKYPGDTCRVHSECVNAPGEFIVCIRSTADSLGKCTQKVKCTSDDDCASASMLPLSCSHEGFCSTKECTTDKDCHEGFGCAHDAQCRKVHKKCDFDCDCSDCVEQVTCHKNKCYCLNDYDDCDNLIGNITQKSRT